MTTITLPSKFSAPFAISRYCKWFGKTVIKARTGERYVVLMKTSKGFRFMKFRKWDSLIKIHGFFLANDKQFRVIDLKHGHFKSLTKVGSLVAYSVLKTNIKKYITVKQNGKRNLP